jgi:hypothetical protein
VPRRADRCRPLLRGLKAQPSPPNACRPSGSRALEPRRGGVSSVTVQSCHRGGLGRAPFYFPPCLIPKVVWSLNRAASSGFSWLMGGGVREKISWLEVPRRNGRPVLWRRRDPFSGTPAPTSLVSGTAGCFEAEHPGPGGVRPGARKGAGTDHLVYAVINPTGNANGYDVTINIKEGDGAENRVGRRRIGAGAGSPVRRRSAVSARERRRPPWAPK